MTDDKNTSKRTKAVGHGFEFEQRLYRHTGRAASGHIVRAVLAEHSAPKTGARSGTLAKFDPDTARRANCPVISAPQVPAVFSAIATLDSDVSVFNHPEFGQIRITDRDGNPWFVAADVCAALNLANVSQALVRLDADEKRAIRHDSTGCSNLINSPEGPVAVTLISEPGLYALVFGANKTPERDRFTRWVTHDVLPSIRKHGMYATDDVLDKVLNDDKQAEKILQALLDERRKRRDVEAVVKQLTPDAEYGRALSRGRGRRTRLAGRPA